ncbi:MAG: hypothetical protein E7281_04650 [Lachnospiraceae bacterium]|nr:hypothetical protein [Lachnospiraceae bacterium]
MNCVFSVDELMSKMNGDEIDITIDQVKKIEAPDKNITYRFRSVYNNEVLKNATISACVMKNNLPDISTLKVSSDGILEYTLNLAQDNIQGLGLEIQLPDGYSNGNYQSKWNIVYPVDSLTSMISGPDIVDTFFTAVKNDELGELIVFNANADGNAIQDNVYDGATRAYYSEDMQTFKVSRSLYNTYFKDYMGRYLFKRPGYYFIGWSTTEDGREPISINPSDLPKNAVLYAIWDKVNDETNNIQREMVYNTVENDDIIVPENSAVEVESVGVITNQIALSSVTRLIDAVLNNTVDNNILNAKIFELNASGKGCVSIKIGTQYTNKIVVVGHYHNGIWTVQQVRVDKKGYINPYFESFSPISLMVTSSEVPLKIATTEKGASELENTLTADNSSSNMQENTSNISINNNAVENSASDNTVNATGSKKAVSPKTGDSNMILLLYLIILAASALCICSYRCMRQNNK